MVMPSTNPRSEMPAVTHHSAFSRALRAIAIGASTVGVSVGLAGMEGCSPKASSYWFGSYSKLPDPPSDARLQIGVSTESDGAVFINYIVWDSSANLFKRKDIHYTTTTLHPGSFTEAGGYMQRILDGEVLASGAVVDQQRGVILLPGGLVLDGRSGDVMDKSGEIVKKHGE